MFRSTRPARRIPDGDADGDAGGEPFSSVL
jgi:hypothetical protein